MKMKKSEINEGGSPTSTSNWALVQHCFDTSCLAFFGSASVYVGLTREWVNLSLVLDWA